MFVNPSICCLVALALPGLLWLLWGKPVTVVIEACIEAFPPCILLLELGRVLPHRFRQEANNWRRMYRWLSPFPRLAQTELPCTLGPRAVKEDLRVRPGPWSQVARPTLLSLTMVAADASKPTTSGV